MPANALSTRRLVVVGGGITGLAAAQRLVDLRRQASPVESAIEIELVESSPQWGGVFGTEQIGDYTIERGADSFITNKPGAVQLAHRLGIEERLISPNPEFQRSLILHGGKTIPTPVGFNLLAPSRIWPMLTTPLLSWRGKVRLGFERFIPTQRDQTDESLASFVRRRFGQELLDRIVQPMVGGIYTADPERLSLQATLPRFLELERTYGSLIKGLRSNARQATETKQASGARYGLFATPQGGMSELLDALVQSISPEVKLTKGKAVQQVSQPAGSDGFDLLLDSSEVLRADGLILALPAYVSGGLLAGIDPLLSSALQEIEYASSAILVSGHRLSDIRHPLDAFGLVIPHVESRRILAVSFLSRKFPTRAPGDRVILRTFIGGAMQPEEYARSDAEVIETALGELHDILGVRGEPEFTRLARYERAMPQYTVGHLQRVANIRERARMYPALGLAGNAFEGVGVPDCIQSGETSATAVWNTVCGG